MIHLVKIANISLHNKLLSIEQMTYQLIKRLVL